MNMKLLEAERVDAPSGNQWLGSYLPWTQVDCRSKSRVWAAEWPFWLGRTSDHLNSLIYVLHLIIVFVASQTDQWLGRRGALNFYSTK